MQLLLLAILALPQAFATTTDCETALASIQAALGETPKTEVYDEASRAKIYGRDQKPTLMVDKYIEGAHGGKRIVIRRTGARWLSDYRSVRYDPQGDPRWFIEIMGAEAAEFFGFKILSDEMVIVPDGNEFNGALKKVNAQLAAMGEEPVEITFYVTSGNENTKVAEYVHDFGKSGGIPLAASGNHLIHDLSFHTGSIFLPGKLVRLAKFFSRYVDGFAKFILEKYKNDPAKFAAAKHYAFLLRMHHTILIDHATGLVNAGIVASLRKPNDAESREMLFTPVAFLSGSGNTARTYWAEKINALSPTGMDYFKEYANMIATKEDGTTQFQITEKAVQSLSLYQLLSDLSQFDALKNVDGSAEFSKTFISPEQGPMEELCMSVGRRRLTVRQAALAIRPRN